MVMEAKIIQQEREVQELIDFVGDFENRYGIDLEDYEPEPKGGDK